MNFKKLGIITLSTVMMMTPFSTIVLADDTTKTSDTTVKYTQADSGSWEWTVPAGSGEASVIDLSNGAKKGTLKISSANIPSDKKIDVTAAGQGTNGEFIMTKTNDSSKTYDFSLSYGDDNKPVTPKETVLLSYASTDTGEKSTTITFTPGAKKPSVGEYSGKVTFTATLKDAQ